MENGQDRIEIPEIVYQGDDKKLKERIFKFKTGSLRIGVFTLIGLILGFYSHTYVTDTFFPTKVIMAIPYKISEAIYVSVLGTDAKKIPFWDWPVSPNAFFPHSWLATVMAELVTVVLISGAIYGSLAYFTGDKRIFTLQRFLKFAGCWCAAILLCIGLAYGINSKAVADNERLRGEPEFFLYHGEMSGVEGGHGFYEESANALRELLYNELSPTHIQRNAEDEIPMHLIYALGRVGEYKVNCQECYLVTEQGRLYHISEEFAAVLSAYYESGVLPEGIQGIPLESSTEAGEEME